MRKKIRNMVENNYWRNYRKQEKLWKCFQIAHQRLGQATPVYICDTLNVPHVPCSACQVGKCYNPYMRVEETVACNWA